MTVELGSERLLPEFEAGLVGKSAGEEADLDVTFPDDYGAEDLAGKAAVFHIKVNEVREKELPELDDDFAQSASEFDTLEELRGEIRDRLAEIIERRSEIGVPRRRRRGRGGERHDRPSARPDPRPRPRALGALRAHTRCPRHRPADVRADAGHATATR